MRKEEKERKKEGNENGIRKKKESKKSESRSYPSEAYHLFQ